MMAVVSNENCKKWGGSKPGKRANIDKDFGQAHRKLMPNYFSPPIKRETTGRVRKDLYTPKYYLNVVSGCPNTCLRPCLMPS